jgi:hypothetical protein
MLPGLPSAEGAGKIMENIGLKGVRRCIRIALPPLSD